MTDLSLKAGLARLLTVISLLFLSVVHAAEPLDKVSLQLDWKFQYQFAGFIMAKEKGFYEDVGLDVELLEYKGDVVKFPH